MRDSLRGGALLAQVAHAAGGSVIAPLPIDSRVVILSATKEQLAEVTAALKIDHFKMNEDEGPLAGVLTAIGFVTTDRESLPPAVRRLKPWRAT